MLILVDLDGVLRDTAKTALDWIKEKYGAKFEKREWKKWNPTFGGHISGAEAALAVTVDPLWIEQIPAIPYASTATRAIFEMGHDVEICTCVPHTTERYTLEWLNRHQITYQGLRFFQGPGDKATYPGHVLIDDHPDAVAAFLGKLGILFNQPWNQRMSRACFTIDAPMGQSEVNKVLTGGGIIRAIGWKHVLRIVKRMTDIETKGETNG